MLVIGELAKELKHNKKDQAAETGTFHWVSSTDITRNINLFYSSGLIREPVEDKPMGYDLIDVVGAGKALSALSDLWNQITPRGGLWLSNK